MMAAYSPGRLVDLLNVCVTSQESHKRGAALEDLVEHVFCAVPSVKLHDRDVKDEDESQEIDLVFTHFYPMSMIPIPDINIFVECKNEKDRTSAAHVREFGTKLRSRNLGIGILVTTAGLAGDSRKSAHAAIRDELQNHAAIIIVKAGELAELVKTEDLALLLTGRLSELRTLRGYRTL